MVHVKQLYFSKSTCAPNIILFFHQVPENMHITFWCFILINKNKIHYKLFKMFSKNCLKCSCRSTFLAICPHYFLHISHFFMAHLSAGCVCIFKLLIWIKLPLYFKYLSIHLPICYCNELLFIASQICSIHRINFYDVLFNICINSALWYIKKLKYLFWGCLFHIMRVLLSLKKINDQLILN